MEELHQNFNYILEVLGTAAFAMSGAYQAIQKRFDPFGIIIIAFVTAIGGGTIRDLLISVPVAWMNDMLMFWIIIATAFLAMLTTAFQKNYNAQVTLFLFDSLGLGMFTIIGIQKGLQFGLNPVICIVLGTMTGCFGGIIRDTLLNKVPLIFRREIYGTACIVGGLLYFLIRHFTEVSYAFAQISTIILIVLIRTAAVKYHWKIPKFYMKHH